jgi:hypothetical protein
MKTKSDGVVLAGEDSGSSFFLRMLGDAARRFPEALGSAGLPSNPGVFKKTYGDALVRFEAARIASAQRVEIARFLREQMLAELRLRHGPDEAPLLEALRTKVKAPATLTRESTGKPDLRAEVTCDGRTYRGLEVLELVDQLTAAHQLSHAAARGIRWTVEHFESRGGTLDLTGEKFALIGASAELSPAEMLLRAGATVRWLDVKPPSLPASAGRVIASEQRDDVLEHPREVLAALDEFSEGGPVHLGFFAYAPGASRELRLAGAMDALTEVIDPERVKSVSCFVSPTSPGELQPEDAAWMNERVPTMWQRGLARVKALRAPGAVGGVSRAIISLQGAGYQAAQYLAKLISAEVLACSGRPWALSMNVAGITNTKSLSHPLFQAGFVGAPLFGVRIFEPVTTRGLNGLLMLHDLLNPEARVNASASEVERAKAVRAKQVHGAVYGMPWLFESAVQSAAVIGLGRKPQLLLPRER